MTDPDDQDAVTRAAALDLAEAVAAFWGDRLGEEMLGCYLIGSLAHGGFNRRYSDIDFAVIGEAGLEEAMISDMRAAAARYSPDLAPKLSLFWADRGFTKGRFPPLDRIDYLDNAIPLCERQRVAAPRPDLAEVRDYLSGRPFITWAERVDRFARLDALEPEDHKPYLRAHLYPARFVYSWQTGDVASNDAAVAFLREEAPPDLDLALIEQAFVIRHRAADPDDLFAARRRLPDQVEACRSVMRA